MARDNFQKKATLIFNLITEYDSGFIKEINSFFSELLYLHLNTKHVFCGLQRVEISVETWNVESPIIVYIYLQYTFHLVQSTLS